MALTQISTAGVKDDAVTSGKIPANAVGSSELADNAVDTAAIADNAVATAKIATDAVTNAKVANNAINTNEIVNNAVTTVKVADNAITTAKIADSQINNAKIGASAAIAGSKINPSFTSNITITNTQPKIFLTDSNNTSDFSIQNENGNLNLYDETNSASRVRIVADGKVGIGTTSPAGKLHVSDVYHFLAVGGNSTTGMKIGNYDGSSYGVLTTRASELRFDIGDNNKMKIDSSGNVGIGTGTPFDATGYTTLEIGGSTGGAIGFSDDDVSKFEIYGRDSDILIFNRTNGKDIAKIKKGGDIELSDGNLKVASGHGIDFSSTYDGSNVAGVSSTSELLDDYEEGTFQPILKRLMTNGVTETNFYTQGTRQGNYTRIGDRVWISARIHWDGGSTGSGTLILTNLPFTVNTGGANEVPLVVGYRDGLNYTNVTGYGSQNMNRFVVTYFDSNSTYGITPSATDSSGAFYFTAHYELV